MRKVYLGFVPILPRSSQSAFYRVSDSPGPEVSVLLGGRLPAGPARVRGPGQRAGSEGQMELSVQPWAWGGEGLEVQPL